MRILDLEKCGVRFKGMKDGSSNDDHPLAVLVYENSD